MDAPLQVAILVFPDAEVLDFAGPFEVFSVASRLARGEQGLAPFEVFLVGKDGGEVAARHGLRVTPSHSFATVPRADLLIVPGGAVTEALADDAVLEWIWQAHRHTQITASVCTGAFFLAKLGLLDGLAATTHWEDMEHLKAAAPLTELRGGVPYVVQGKIFTSGGISAGIEMCLYLVARLAGADLARRTARQMEYRWDGP